MKKIALDEGFLGRVPRPALIAAAVVVVLAVVAFLFGGGTGAVDSSDQQRWSAGYQPIARNLAKAVSDVLKPYPTALNTIATNEQVASALASGNVDQLNRLASELTPKLDGVLRLRLLPANVRDPEPDASPPLSYASISMLRRARDNASTPDAEVHMAGTDSQHMVFLRRIEAKAEADAEPTLLGFAHLSISPDVAGQVLLAAPPNGVFAELKQGINVQLTAIGNSPGEGAASVSARIAGTSLSIKLTGAGSAASTSIDESGSMLWLGILALVALVAGVAVFRYFQPGVRIAKSSPDSIIYQGAIKAILDGAHPGLEQLMPGARALSTDYDMAALEDRAAGDDITTFSPAGASTDDDPTVPRDNDMSNQPPPAIEVEITEAVPASIFRSYDIRGIVDDTLTEDGVYQIGRALGAEAQARDQKTVVVARDGRHSSEPLLQALTKGLLESGRDVLDIGLAPTPVLYFATHYLDARSGVMITGSHNPAQYNGLKIVLDGETLSGEAIQAIRKRVDEQDFFEGTGSIEQTDIVAEYIRRISEDIPVTLGNALKVVVDCGNGVPGTVAPDILRAIGHDVTELYCDVDGDFPNHHPDPSQPENLKTLIETVLDEGADLGLAFDGDGDRLGVVDGEGNIIWPDRQMILFARDILSRNPGAKIIYDVKCSRLLGAEITASGGEPIMYKTGHSLIKSKMQETGALLAGEMSGHIFFKERWYGFDDALYSAARLLEILINSGQTPAEVFAALPGGVVTPELRLDMAEEQHQAFMEKVLAAANFDGAEVSTIDGLRVDFNDSWGLIRPSNTTPCLVLRFEGDNDAALSAVKENFRSLLSGIDPALELPF